MSTSGLRNCLSTRRTADPSPLDDVPTVLHVAQPTTAGVARGVLAVARDQDRRGWRVSVASPRDGDLPGWLGEAGIRHEAWPATRSPGPSLVGEVRRLRRIVQRVRPDVVHAHSSKAGVAGRLVVRGRRPTVFQPHAWSFSAVDGAMSALALRWERFATRWTDVIVCVSEGECAEGRAAGVGATWLVARNGADLTRYVVPRQDLRAQARDRHGLGEAPTVVCVGRLCHQKGQDVLLNAWPAVRREVPAARLLLVGDGPDRDRLLALSSPGVEWVGEVSDVRPWLTTADVVVLPSRWEGLAYSMLEAMAMGRSIVTTAVNGSEDLVSNGAGAVVPVEDPPALATALVSRLADPARAAAEGRAARALVEGHYDQQAQLDAIAAQALSLLQAPP